MALRQTLQLSGGWKRRPQHTVCCGEYMTITALWTARRSRGPRCPFCSGPSAAPAGLGWASVLLLLELRNTSKIRAGGCTLRPPSPSPHCSSCYRRRSTLPPAASLLTGSRMQRLQGGLSPSPAHLQTGSPPRKAEQEGRYLLHTGWSSAARVAWQTQFSRRPPAQRTETLPWPTWASIAVQDIPQAPATPVTRSCSTVTHTRHSWMPWGWLHEPSQKCFCTSLCLEIPSKPMLEVSPLPWRG